LTNFIRTAHEKSFVRKYRRVERQEIACCASEPRQQAGWIAILAKRARFVQKFIAGGSFCATFYRKKVAKLFILTIKRMLF
jgi:hypothetical protein